ncbi:MAG: OprO/OprP family phosphate-selective porin, partial [Candidatus Methylomirabilis sp.]|nr:OprO/OprP family phosphate-selective porin [Deltaproteobacteria bacterium]
VVERSQSESLSTDPYNRLRERGLLQQAVDAAPGDIFKGVRLGAYGEHHFNFVEGGDGNQSDIHRLVLFLGYDFADWAHLVTETEFEHGFIEDDEGGGGLVMEQFYVDLNILPELNVRLGRALHPAGIVNRLHEPTTFYGVERPRYSNVILPSTWSIDGVGLWGKLTDYLAYEVYVHSGLDGEEFRASDGIRSGRLKERPGMNDLGYSGRIDFFPLAGLEDPGAVDLRLGGSYSYVGTENANRGKGTVPGDVQILAGDMDARLGDLELRAEGAYVWNRAADELANGTADEMFGWYAQAAYHVWPNAWKTGKLADSDMAVFARYDHTHTQHSLPRGVRGDKRLDRRDITFGLSFFPVQRLVLKLDATFPTNATGTDIPHRIDAGFGYDF